MNVTFDTQTAVVDLKAAGFEDQEAHAIVTVIKNSQAELATKRDLVDLEHRLIIKLGAIIVVAFGIFTTLLTYIVKP